MIEHIQANAELVIQQLRLLSFEGFGYDVESVEWLEGYIERLRESGTFETEETREGLVGVLGSFLGECIVRCFGASWTQQDGLWCVAFSQGNAAFPFAKVSKQMTNGLEDGIGGFFRTIPMIFADQVRLISPEELL